jgi:hypothetical protein
MEPMRLAVYRASRRLGSDMKSIPVAGTDTRFSGAKYSTGAYSALASSGMRLPSASTPNNAYPGDLAFIWAAYSSICSAGIRAT